MDFVYPLHYPPFSNEFHKEPMINLLKISRGKTFILTQNRKLTFIVYSSLNVLQEIGPLKTKCGTFEPYFVYFQDWYLIPMFVH
jgi:hypothetical protein